MRLNRLLLLLSIAVPLAATAPAQAATVGCETVSRFMSAYLQNHILHHRLDDQLEERTIDTYLRRFDPSRTVLLEGEVTNIQKELKGAFANVKHKSCTFLTGFHQTLVKEQRGIEDFVRDFIGKPDYEVDTTVELILDPEDRGHPKTVEEQQQLLRNLLHFQMSNYLSADETLENAKKLLVHRYELRTKRLAELETVDLYTAFLDAFATSLDPHSNYLSAEVLEDFRISMTLSLEGIGVALSERDGFAVVERVIPGGAADRLGVLLPKDKIISVAQADGDAVNIIDMPLREAVSLIRGKKGTEVRLTVLRQGEQTKRFPLTIVRDKINLEDQAANLRFEEREVEGKKIKLAILDLPSFYGGSNPTERQSTDDVARLLRQVNEEKADGLVLDLSRNGGGLLDHAVTISGFFLRRGEIVGVENARGGRQILSDEDDGILFSGPMVVHTSRVSASAAEILAGALQDYKRAIIAGDDHTFGKGTVQTVSSLPPGQGALKITTGMFFLPGGRSTQNDGVRSDVVIPSLLTSNDFGEKTQRYALENQATTPFLSSYANAVPATNRWQPVSSDVVSKLAQRSHERVGKSEEFAEIREKLKEAEANDGVVRLADILKEQEEVEEEEDAAEGEEKEKISPQLEEATSILADLVALHI
ncbi:MAG: PDZ domain-containing protein [Deltaproteobacteria bacterium]|nr:PDZ domain-containing protein [Deltaproteobacteria bacterium]